MRILHLVGLSGVIAAAVATFLAPKFESDPTSSAIQAPTPRDLPKDINFANAAIIDRLDDGHYWARADVNGTDVQFMVDTGASIVALTQLDAARIGLEPDKLDYKWEIRTAGGIAYGAAVTLDSIRIGQVEVESVAAIVMLENLDQSLLGMSYLSELYSYEFRQSTLIIRR